MATRRDNSWPTVRLNELFDLDTTACNPSKTPRDLFLHYSIPAWDVTGGPVVEPGMAIESNKRTIVRRGRRCSSIFTACSSATPRTSTVSPSTFQSLPEVDRAALLMHAQDGLPYAVAAALELTVAAVKVRVQRARIKLRKLFDPKRGDEP